MGEKTFQSVKQIQKSENWSVRHLSWKAEANNALKTQRKYSKFKLSQEFVICIIINKSMPRNLKKKKLRERGTWKKSEHDKFMKALEKYGRNWVKVQEVVKTRTINQIRSHAQKAFINMTDADVDALIAPSINLQSESQVIRIKKKSRKAKIKGVELNHSLEAEQKNLQNSSERNACEGNYLQQRKEWNHHQIPRNLQQNMDVKPQRNSSEDNTDKQIQSESDRLENDSIFIRILMSNLDYFGEGGNLLRLLYF